MHTPTLFLACGLVPLALATYGIQDDYSGNNFLNMFTYDTEDDPTHGYVNYVDADIAYQDNYTSVNNGVVNIRSDSFSSASGRGRNSIRLTSKAQYTHGLVVLDLEHMPGSACGIWPAFWMTGPSWPNNGEIDIIEGVNYQFQNAMTLHTNGGCSMNGKDCQNQPGCGAVAGGSASWGDGFNNAQGGVYAMEWTSDAINIWFFTRNSVPSGISGDSPDPSTWGNPTASFQGGSGCDIDQHFQNHNIVFDTTFCGDWAGQVWSQDATCGPKAATCQDYVANNPEAFTEAYWEINSLKVYSQGANNAPALTPTPSLSSTPIPVASPISTPPLEPSTTAATAVPTPESTTTSAVAPPSTASTSPAADNEGLTVNADGSVTEGPINGRDLKVDYQALAVEVDGSVTEHPVVKRDANDSAHEEIEFKKRSFAELKEEEVLSKREKVGRHLRRHRMDFGVRMHKH